MELSQAEIIVPLVIIIGVGAVIGTRLWLMFGK